MKKVALVVLLAACANRKPPEPLAEAAAAPAPPVDAGTPAPVTMEAPAEVDAGPPPAEPEPAPKVKVENIGMHVAGGPFDEPTKVPFRKAVEPHYPAMARCWAKHIPHPPKSADVGVDLLIEAAGGTPKVSNPRSNLAGAGPAMAAETKEFVPCLVKVFEGVEFPKLVDRGRTGVSYSLRFTAAKP